MIAMTTRSSIKVKPRFDCSSGPVVMEGGSEKWNEPMSIYMPASSEPDPIGTEKTARVLAAGNLHTFLIKDGDCEIGGPSIWWRSINQDCCRKSNKFPVRLGRSPPTRDFPL